jgi:hypothetical protein
MFKIRSLLLSILILMSLTQLSAQPGTGPTGGGAPGSAPISGIEWLLLGGGILGARKVYANFKNRK